jgi:hypothetical protein
MKRKVLAKMIGAGSVLGLAVSVQAQQVAFDNYDASPYYQVRYTSTASLAPAGLAGASAGANVDVELGYALGANQVSGFTLVPSSITAINPALGVADNGVGPVVHGWFQGPAVTVNGYSSGAVTFEILAWVASGTGAGGGTYANSGYNGSLIWTEASIPGSGLPAGDFKALTGDTILVATVPEPTTLALAGLAGLVSLVAYRRKQV